MDFQTMRSNIALNRYRIFEHVEADFNLVVANCLRYNAKDTVYYKAGLKLRDQGGQVRCGFQWYIANSYLLYLV